MIGFSDKTWDLDQPSTDIDSVFDVQTWEKCSDLKFGKSRARQVKGLISGVSGCKNGKTLNQPKTYPIVFFCFLPLFLSKHKS